VNYSSSKLRTHNKPAVGLGFLLNTLNEKLYLGLEHLALVGRLWQSLANGTTQRFLVIVAPYLSQQFHLTTDHTTTRSAAFVV